MMQSVRQNGVDIIMFDNMTVKEIQKAVKTLEEKDFG